MPWPYRLVTVSRKGLGELYASSCLVDVRRSLFRKRIECRLLKGPSNLTRITVHAGPLNHENVCDATYWINPGLSAPCASVPEGSW